MLVDQKLSWSTKEVIKFSSSKGLQEHKERTQDCAFKLNYSYAFYRRR